MQAWELPTARHGASGPIADYRQWVESERKSMEWNISSQLEYPVEVAPFASSTPHRRRLRNPSAASPLVAWANLVGYVVVM